MSQLDLALGANVSARHVSFLENSRAAPSREMVLRLATTLSVPFRDQNALLRSAGFDSAFAEPDLFEGGLPAGIVGAIEGMLQKHEPYPMIVLDRAYNLLRSNAGAAQLLARFVSDPTSLPSPVNAFTLLFDPRLSRSFVVDWEKTARALVSRLHREVLAQPESEALQTLLASLFEFPGVPETWRQPDFGSESEPIMVLRLRKDDLELAFLTTVTAFNAPQNVTLEELRIESYFPLDAPTRVACEAMPRGGVLP